MSRNKLYSCRLEVCITPDQRKKIDKMAGKSKTANEIIREAIEAMYEKNY